MGMNRQHDIMWYVAEINREFSAMALNPITQDQIDCLRDPERADEALDMLDDWEARLGLRGYWREELGAYIQDNYHVHQRG
jgi:hypothetical protein